MTKAATAPVEDHALPPPAERRRHERRLTFHAARLIVDGAWHDCVIRDICVSGARLDAIDPPRPEARIALYIRDVGLLPCKAVRDNVSGFSVAFDDMVADPARLCLAFETLGHENPKAT